MWPCYDDWINKPRTLGCNGNHLPNARFISRKLHSFEDIDTNVTILHTYMGQFIDHGKIYREIKKINLGISILTNC
jgi:hypothetical protein